MTFVAMDVHDEITGPWTWKLDWLAMPVDPLAFGWRTQTYWWASKPRLMYPTR